MNFYPIKTNDNTISLFNLDINDVYHSKVGAYTEALHKYVIPSGLKEFSCENKSIKILDVCFGLGYNSKTAINEIIKIFHEKHEIDIYVTALEIDPDVLAFSTIIGNECFDGEINNSFFKAISSQINVKETIENYLKKTAQIMPQIQDKIPSQYELIQLDKIKRKLHNIYYQSISNRNIYVDIYLQDARKTVENLITDSYDFVFLDAFTPSKSPVLWTVEFFTALYRLLNNNGNLTTYSSAAPVRAALIEAGFYIGQTSPVGKKLTGTIAYKNSSFLKNDFKLSDKEAGLLKTKAGIPYRDKNLASTTEEILLNRENEKQNSKRISSGKFLKS